MLNLDMTKRAVKFIESLPPKQKKQITTKIIELRFNPEPHDTIQVKGFPQFRRASAGGYRVIYHVKGEVLLVSVLVGRRSVLSTLDEV